MVTEYIITLGILISVELVLGIDNLIFISVAVNNVRNLKDSRQIRFFGLSLALIFRLIMLFGISLILKASQPVFLSFSIKDLLFLSGGVFLFAKSLKEVIYDIINGPHIERLQLKEGSSSKISIILQIAFMDLVFSLDSLIVAIGLTKNIILIAIAFIITIVFMAIASGYVLKYVNLFPELKMLALASIIIIGGVLILEGLHVEVSKTYIYFSLLFSLIVEILNIIKKFNHKEPKLPLP